MESTGRLSADSAVYFLVVVLVAHDFSAQSMQCPQAALFTSFMKLVMIWRGEGGGGEFGGVMMCKGPVAMQ